MVESVQKTIIITGCNKGIGYGIVENLFQKNYKIIMACRDLNLATKAKEQLEYQFPSAKGQLFALQLDISNSASIDTFIKNFVQQFKTTDILINNAGAATKGDLFNEEVVKNALQTNFYGTVEFSEKMIPYIVNSGKIITVGSQAGKFAGNIKNPDVEKAYRDKYDNFDKLTKQDLFNFAEEYLSFVRQEVLEAKGFKKWGYGFSKLLINLYQRVLARLVNDKSIQVYGLCPGWVKTDMAGYEKPPLSIQEGALTPVYLVELPFEVNKDFQGKFFFEKQVRDL